MRTCWCWPFFSPCRRFFAAADGKGYTFHRRDVVAGSVHEGTVPIYSGLVAGDPIVVQGAVLLDNQIQIAN